MIIHYIAVLLLSIVIHPIYAGIREPLRPFIVSYSRTISAETDPISNRDGESHSRVKPTGEDDPTTDFLDLLLARLKSEIDKENTFAGISVQQEWVTCEDFLRVASLQTTNTVDGTSRETTPLTSSVENHMSSTHSSTTVGSRGRKQDRDESSHLSRIYAEKLYRFSVVPAFGGYFSKAAIAFICAEGFSIVLESALQEEAPQPDSASLTNYFSVEADNTIFLDQVDLCQYRTGTGVSKWQMAPVPTWGIDRIDQTALPLNHQYNYAYTGQGVRVYVIDSGVNASHQEFAGRIEEGINFMSDREEGSPDVADCNGHGSHVSSIILGHVMGVAKEANLVPVRAFGCNGQTTLTAILKGLDWIAEDVMTHGLPAVVNISFGTPSNKLLDSAVSQLVADNIVVAVSAGNNGQDACSHSPVSGDGIVQVAASNWNDEIAYFSNLGECVDIIAPGQFILGAYHTKKDQYTTLSGTSMATPHVTGVLALLREALPNADAYTIKRILLGIAQEGVINLFPQANTPVPVRTTSSILHYEMEPNESMDIAAGESTTNEAGRDEENDGSEGEEEGGIRVRYLRPLRGSERNRLASLTPNRFLQTPFNFEAPKSSYISLLTRRRSIPSDCIAGPSNASSSSIAICGCGAYPGWSK